MAVEVFSGTVGSGKSLHAAQSIRFALAAGKLVICNFELAAGAPCDTTNFVYISNEDLCVDAILEQVERWWSDPAHSFKEGGILLVIDECQ